jgi:hypothetical protein
MSNTEIPVVSAAQALDRLKAGNERFVAGAVRFPTVKSALLAASLCHDPELQRLPGST